jgi:hypothetical protein
MTEPTPASNKHSWLFNLGLAVLSCGLVLMVFEVGLRLVGFSYPSLIEMDPVVGYKLRPNSEGWNLTEGRSYVRINSQGLRDREHSKAKPPNTYRIAVLGDSMVEARQVPFEKSFVPQLEQDLAGCDAFRGKNVEVINFGVGGYGTGQELLMLRKEAWSYSPDMVLLTFTSANDVSDNSSKLSRGDPAPYFYVRDGQLVLDDSYLHTRSFRLKNGTAWRIFIRLSDYLKTIQLLNKAKNAWVLMREGTRTKQKNTQFDRGLYDEIYREPPDEDWREAWATTEKLIETMNQEVRAKGAKFLVVTLSIGVQVNPDAQFRESFLGQVGGTDLFYTDKRVQAFARQNGMDVVMLGPTMQHYAEAHHVYLHGFPNTRMGFGHWNEDGHRVAAQIVADHICAESKP